MFQGGVGVQDDTDYRIRIARMNQEWRQSSERKRALIIRVALIVGGAALWILWVFNHYNEDFRPFRFLDPDDPTGNAGTVIIAAVIYTIAAVWLNDIATRHYKRIIGDRVSLQIAAELAAKRADIDANDNGKLDLIEIWQYNKDELSNYSGDAREQAQRSFNRALSTSTIGFITIVVTVVIILYNPEISVATSVAGSVGAALSGFISITFLRTYRDATNHIQQAFKGPITLSSLLNAERVADFYLEKHSPERVAAFRDIIAAAVPQHGEPKVAVQPEPADTQPAPASPEKNGWRLFRRKEKPPAIEDTAAPEQATT